MGNKNKMNEDIYLKLEKLKKVIMENYKGSELEFIVYTINDIFEDNYKFYHENIKKRNNQ